jgi:hypothetical protein
MDLNQSRLGDLLLHRRLISAQQLEQAIAHQHKYQKPLGQILVDLNYISAEQIDRVLNEQNFRRSGFWVID